MAECGTAAFIAKNSAPKRVWNRLSQAERDLIESEARKHTELSPRMVALMLTEQHGVAVSETTVYRVLKAKGFVRQQPQDQRPAAKEWKKPTKAANEIWQLDATSFFIPEFAYYKAIPVIDDHSRKLLERPVKPDESSQSASDAMELGLEAAQREGHAADVANGQRGGVRGRDHGKVPESARREAHLRSAVSTADAGQGGAVQPDA